MSKRSCFWTPFNKQHGKRDQTLLKSEWYHLYHICWSLWRQLSWKKYLLVISKFLRLFVKILTADDKYSLLNRDNIRQPVQIQLTQKQKNKFRICFCLFEIYLISWTFSNKYQCHRWFISEIKGSENRAKIKSLKGPLSEDPWTINILRVTKHCWNLNGSTFNIFIDHCEGNWVGKISLSDRQILKTIS